MQTQDGHVFLTKVFVVSYKDLSIDITHSTTPTHFRKYAKI